MSVQKIKGVSFFCPAYHDAENIAHVVDKADKVLSELCEDYEIIVVNDGSPDNTADVLAKLSGIHDKLKVVTHPRNLGYAEALKTGFKTARKFETVLFTDGDNQYDVEYFRDMVPYLGDYDAVITYRTSNANSFIRRVISWVFNRTLNIMFNEPYRDLSCAFRLVKRSAFDNLELRSINIFLPIEIILKLHRKKFRIKEIPMKSKKRLHGRSTSLLPKNFMSVIVDMFKIRIKDF